MEHMAACLRQQTRRPFLFWTLAYSFRVFDVVADKFLHITSLSSKISEQD